MYDHFEFVKTDSEMGNAVSVISYLRVENNSRLNDYFYYDAFMYIEPCEVLVFEVAAEPEEAFSEEEEKS